VLYLENIKVLVHIEVRIAGAEKKCSVFAPWLIYAEIVLLKNTVAFFFWDTS